MKPGAEISRFRIDDSPSGIGAGETYTALDTRSDRRVTLTLLPELGTDQGLVSLARRDIEAIAVLGHPNIVPIDDLGEAAGRYFVTMPVVAGESLDRWVPERGTLLGRFLEISISLADAVSAAHGVGVLHGDLSAGNVVIDTEGTTRILHFGLHRLLASDFEGFPPPSRRRRDGTLEPGRSAARPGDASASLVDLVSSGDRQLRTLACRSPERLQGKAIDARADVFSLGALLYELATGRPPFAANDAKGLRRAVLEDDPPLVEAVRPSLPHDLSRIVQRCLQKDPERRFQSAEDLRNELAELDAAVRSGKVEISADRPLRPLPSVAKAPGRSGPTPPGPREGVGPPGTPTSRLDTPRPERFAGRGETAEPRRPRPADSEWADAWPADSSPADSWPADPSPTDSRPVDSWPAESRSVDPGPLDPWSPDSRPPDSGAAIPRAAASGPPASGPPGSGPPASRPPTSRPPTSRPPTSRPPASRPPGSPPTPRPPADGRHSTAASSSFIDWRFVAAAGVLALALFLAGFYLAGSGPSTALPMAPRLIRSTAEAGLELFPSPSADGSSIVFAALRDGDWDLWVQAIDEPLPRRLTDDPGVDDTQPALSPDGARVAFRSTRQGGGIFVMDIEEGWVKRLADFGFDPAWSPDGRHLAVAGRGVYDSPYIPRDESALWVLEVESGASRLLVEDGALQPSWSPGASRIVYWRLAPDSGRADLWTVPADGGDAVAATQDAPTDWSPTWSPDGRYLYFSSDRGGSFDIWRLPIDEGNGAVGGPPEPVTTGGAMWSFHPRFAAAAGTLAYVEGLTRYDIYRLSFDAGRGAVTGRPEAVIEGARNVLAPDPSPDGEWIAFVTGAGQQEDVYVARVDGSDLRALTHDAAPDHLPRWSPDGRRLAFFSRRQGTFQIWTVEPDGSNLRQLTDLRGRDADMPAWTPDASRLSFRASGAFMPQLTFLLDPSIPTADQTLETLPPMSGEDHFEAVAWSPDGRRLAGTVRLPDGRAAGIAAYSLSDHTYERLTDFGAFPVWLQDGARLLFSAGNQLFLMDRRAPQPRPVFSSVDSRLGATFSISRDNRWIYVSLADGESDIWILDHDGQAR